MNVYGHVELLTFESDFFSLRSGKLVFDVEAPPLNFKVFEAYDLVQARVPTDNMAMVDALSAMGFCLAEGEIDFIVEVDEQRAVKLQSLWPDTWSELVAEEQHIGALRGLAARVFRHSRFRPPWYKAEDNELFYALWAEKSVRGTFDHQCLLMRDEQENLLGFVTLRLLTDGEARIGLLAVCPGKTGQGIGTALLAAAEQWCAKRAITRLRVATQLGNLAGWKHYVNYGAALVSASYWLYRAKSV